MKYYRFLSFFFLLLPAFCVAETLEDLLVEKGLITKSEAQEVRQPENARVYWNEGTRVEFDDSGFTSKLNASVITRYTYFDSDRGDGANSSSFSTERARVAISGTVLYGEFSYMLSAEFTDGEDPLRDAYLEWHACDFSGVRMGQFKPLISRQFNTPYTQLLFPDRSLVSDFFTIDRNQGVQGSIDLSEKVLFTAQLLNGISDEEGINSSGRDTSHTGVLALRAHLMGEMDALSESNLRRTEDAALDIGAAVALSEATQSMKETDITTVSADVNYMIAGFSANGEFFYQEDDPAENSSIQSTGYYLQAGYFLTPQAFEVAARYSSLDCDNGAARSNGFSSDIANSPSCEGNDSVDAIDLGFNYYWWKQHLKAQFAWMMISEDALSGPGNDSDRLIFQLSGWF